MTHLQQNFAVNSDDVDWLPIVAKKGWFLITRDLRILKNPPELEAFRQHGVRAFFLAGKNRSRCELIMQLVRNWPHIKQHAGATARPFAFKVPASGAKLKRMAL